MSNPLCIWHGNCQDGFGAAWVVQKAFAGGVEFHPGVYQEPPPDTTDRDVIIVDFSYKSGPMFEIVERAKSVLVLDHHSTTPPEMEEVFLAIKGDRTLTGKLHFIFDTNRSGAGITWDHYNPAHQRPRLINHIEDRDLWRFKNPNTRAVSANLFSYPYDFGVWDKLIERCQDEVFYPDFVMEGVAIERKAAQDIKNLLPVVERRMVIGGVEMPVASMPITLTSDAGHDMARRHPSKAAACYWDTPEGRVFSLRSLDSGPDVAQIAKGYGGGGHPHAAGFRIGLGWEGDSII